MRHTAELLAGVLLLSLVSPALCGEATTDDLYGRALAALAEARGDDARGALARCTAILRTRWQEIAPDFVKARAGVELKERSVEIFSVEGVYGLVANFQKGNCLGFERGGPYTDGDLVLRKLDITLRRAGRPGLVGRVVREISDESAVQAIPLALVGQLDRAIAVMFETVRTPRDREFIVEALALTKRSADELRNELVKVQKAAKELDSRSLGLYEKNKAIPGSAALLLVSARAGCLAGNEEAYQGRLVLFARTGFEELGEVAAAREVLDLSADLEQLSEFADAAKCLDLVINRGKDPTGVREAQERKERLEARSKQDAPE